MTMTTQTRGNTLREIRTIREIIAEVQQALQRVEQGVAGVDGNTAPPAVALLHAALRLQSASDRCASLHGVLREAAVGE